MQQGVDQLSTSFITGDKARFQAVAECHQFINLGDDTVLLGERWEGDFVLAQIVRREVGLSGPIVKALEHLFGDLTLEVYEKGIITLTSPTASRQTHL